MFEEESESADERGIDPVERASRKSDEFRMHAELAAVFEGVRKFEAGILPKFDAQIARDCQKAVARLEKERIAESPIISPEFFSQAAEMLDLPETKEISTNDYHIYRRPGEVMLLRWLAGDQVESFYTRLQAHFDAALRGFVEEQHANEWKQDEQTNAFLAALDKIDVKMEEKYVREPIREHRIFVLSTQTADEININHLADFIMGVPAAEIVGAASAPSDDPSDRARAWFFKLFSLRGIVKGQERMLFFTYLQKSDEADEDDFAG